jgi:hypothetical protein
VTFLGRCDEGGLAWDLFWATHRLIREGKLEVLVGALEAEAEAIKTETHKAAGTHLRPLEGDAVSPSAMLNSLP